jgi:ABC-2 type transport system permease protein
VNAFLALLRTEVVLYFSNRRAVLISLAAPILIAAFLGAVLGGAPRGPTRIPIAIVDQDASDLTRRVIAAMRSDAAFDVRVVDEAQAVRLVREGKVRAAAVLPAGFGEAAPRAFFRPDAVKPAVVVHYDPSQSMAMPLVQGLLARHAASEAGRSAFGAARRAGGAMPGFTLPFETKSDPVTSGSGRSYNGYAHSFAGMGVQFVLFMGIEVGVALLLLRRRALWKRLRAAPVSRARLLGSRVASGTLIATLLVAGIYAAAIAFFGVRIEGSYAGFAAVALAFALLTSSFGLLIAALGRTPEATRGLAILATLLLVMLGGAWVPTFVFPEWLQQATQYVPTRWAIDGLEAMTWRGLGWEAAWRPALAMLACSALFAVIAVKRFAWEE